MKKIIAALLACLLAVSCFASAFALDIDYAALTDAELDELSGKRLPNAAAVRVFMSP